MNYDKLTETLRQHGVSCVRAHGRYCSICDEAATALSTLQAENESLKEKLYDGEGVNLVDYWMQQAKIEENGHRNCQAENEKLRAELEQVKAEKDAAVESIPHECKTCVYHTVFFNGCTLDHDCTNPDGGCSNNNDRWKWRGSKKED